MTRGKAVKERAELSCVLENRSQGAEGQQAGRRNEVTPPFRDFFMEMMTAHSGIPFPKDL